VELQRGGPISFAFKVLLCTPFNMQPHTHTHASRDHTRIPCFFTKVVSALGAKGIDPALFCEVYDVRKEGGRGEGGVTCVRD
jgi:hypothetical protein